MAQHTITSWQVNSQVSSEKKVFCTKDLRDCEQVFHTLLPTWGWHMRENMGDRYFIIINEMAKISMTLYKAGTIIIFGDVETMGRKDDIEAKLVILGEHLPELQIVVEPLRMYELLYKYAEKLACIENMHPNLSIDCNLDF